MSVSQKAPIKLLTGDWGSDVTWEFYVSNEVPSPELCTSVMCVAMTRPGEFVLTHNHRGWELPGGHIELGETTEEALLRELMEEAGYIPETYQLFGYCKILSTRPMPHAQRDGFYPFPASYMPYYVATSTLLLQKPTGDPAEIFGAKVFSLDEIGSVREEFMQIAIAGQRALVNDMKKD